MKIACRPRAARPVRIFALKEDDANKVERQVGKSASAMPLESRIGERFDRIDPNTLAPLPAHRTNTGSKLGQTAARVSDRSRFRSPAGRLTV